MLIQLLLSVVGLVVLTVAADQLVLGSSRLAHRMRVRPVVVGVVVIGLGTSAPEFLVSGVAAAGGDTGIAVGNIMGSNILNLTLILGVAALVGAVRVTSAVIRREVPLAVASVGLFACAAWIGLTPVTGGFLAVAVVVALWMLVRWATRDRGAELAAEAIEFAEDDDSPARTSTRRSAWVEPLRSVLGLAGVLAGAQLLVTNASTIATDLGVPQFIVGFTLVALGTSLPELVTTIQAMRRGEADLVVGNLFGSNLFNSLAGGAVVGFASGAHPAASTSVAMLVTMVATSGLAWVLLRRGLRLSRTEGVVLLAAYLLTVPILLSA